MNSNKAEMCTDQHVKYALLFSYCQDWLTSLLKLLIRAAYRGVSDTHHLHVSPASSNVITRSCYDDNNQRKNKKDVLVVLYTSLIASWYDGELQSWHQSTWVWWAKWNSGHCGATEANERERHKLTEPGITGLNKCWRLNGANRGNFLCDQKCIVLQTHQEA